MMIRGSRLVVKFPPRAAGDCGVGGTGSDVGSPVGDGEEPGDGSVGISLEAADFWLSFEALESSNRVSCGWGLWVISVNWVTEVVATGEGVVIIAALLHSGAGGWGRVLPGGAPAHQLHLALNPGWPAL